jgi:hypothetical protein
LPERNDYNEAYGEPDHCTGNDIRRIVDAHVDPGEANEARIREESPGPTRQEVRQDHSSSEVVHSVRRWKRIAAPTTYEEMDIGQLKARAWTVDEELQERTVELIAQGDRRDEEQGGNPSRASSFGKQKQPEDRKNDNADGFPIDIGEEWKHNIKQPISCPLIEEKEQLLVKVDERIEHRDYASSELG